MFVGDEQYLEISEVKMFENESNSWTTTVTYKPLAEHSEKTLKCEAHYDNNDEVQEPKKMAQIVLGFTKEHIAKMSNNSKNSGSADENEIEEIEVGIESIAVIIVVSIFLLCLAIVIMWSYRLCCFKNWRPRPTEEVDAENPKVKI